MINKIASDSVGNFAVRLIAMFMMLSVIDYLDLKRIFVFSVGLLLWTLAVMFDSKGLVINIDKRKQ
ncbi:MAG: hypothetical protein ACRCX2_34630 [Paraclostridium sp.]